MERIKQAQQTTTFMMTMKILKIYNSTIKRIVWVFANLGFKEFFKLVLLHTATVNHFFILHANLSSKKFIKNVRINYYLNKVDEKDIDEITSQMKTFSANDKKEIIVRLFFYLSGFKNCYIARSIKGEIMYMQWIIYPNENEIIERFYLNRFKLLKKNQILLENAFTFPRYRGLGLFAAVTSDLLQKSKDEGYKGAIAYIRKNALDSLNEFFKQGFKLNAIIREYKILGMTKRML